MTTVQIVGIAVAAAVVALLVIALLVTRRRGASAADKRAQAAGSFLDAPPQDTLDHLGRAEVPVEDVTLDPEATRALRETRPLDEPAAGSGTGPDTAPATPMVVQPSQAVPPEPPASAAPEADDRPLSLDWGPPSSEPELPPRSTLVMAAAGSAPPSESDTGSEPVRASDPEPSPRPSRKVPLADIIVTTSRKVVDLEDPEVRRMLTDLVKFEVDQATRYRQQGQRIDAVLQLTEAEKISRALGMHESADAIRLMVKDLEG